MELTYDPKIIGGQLKKLSEYLRIPYYTMTKRCGLTQNNLVEEYAEGKIIPTLTTINKIIKRYPVRSEWLLSDKGPMWTEDYFEKRFKDYNGSPKSPGEKIDALLEILEITMRQLHRDTGISITRLTQMRKEKTGEISPKLISMLRVAYPFIPYEWYLNK